MATLFCLLRLEKQKHHSLPIAKQSQKILDTGEKIFQTSTVKSVS